MRDGGKVRNETVANLSELPNPVIDLIWRALAGETFVPASEALVTESSLPTGHVRAVVATMKHLGIADLLLMRGCRERDLVLGMIVTARSQGPKGRGRAGVPQTRGSGLVPWPGALSLQGHGAPIVLSLPLLPVR